MQQRSGVRPQQIADLIALRGDRSDGIPGAKGIGEKGAAALLRSFKEIATLQPVKLKRPKDAALNAAGGAVAARQLGIKRLAERLEQR